MNFPKTQAFIRFLVIYCILITIYIFDKTQFNSIKLDKCLPNKHSVCFINKRFCHPGYTGEKCDVKLICKIILSNNKIFHFLKNNFLIF